jgi:hypothetical protein
MKKGKRPAAHALPPISARAASCRRPAQQAALLIEFNVPSALTLCRFNLFCLSCLAIQLKGQSSNRSGLTFELFQKGPKKYGTRSQAQATILSKSSPLLPSVGALLLGLSGHQGLAQGLLVISQGWM